MLLSPHHVPLRDIGFTMSTTVSVLGGVGLFRLGMSVMTVGRKALAGPRLCDRR
jgi:hypothetical protein